MSPSTVLVSGRKKNIKCGAKNSIFFKAFNKTL